MSRGKICIDSDGDILIRPSPRGEALLMERQPSGGILASILEPDQICFPETELDITIEQLYNVITKLVNDGTIQRKA